ncbi:MAG: hypothetical protein M5U12_26875 [Verrucomicrobia bacterium]|nr:hypothetical protein [Verrucomicrobiota bacterium]
MEQPYAELGGTRRLPTSASLQGGSCRPKPPVGLPFWLAGSLLVAASGAAQPVLDIRPLAGGVELSWDAAAEGYVPETVSALGPGVVWQVVAEPVTLRAGRRVLTLGAGTRLAFTGYAGGDGPGHGGLDFTRAG